MDFEQGCPLTIFRRVFTISHRNASFRSSPTATWCCPRSAPRTTSRRCTPRPTGASRRTPSGRSSPGTSTSEQVGRIRQHCGGKCKNRFSPHLLERVKTFQRFTLQSVDKCKAKARQLSFDFWAAGFCFSLTFPSPTLFPSNASPFPK